MIARSFRHTPLTTTLVLLLALTVSLGLNGCGGNGELGDAGSEGPTDPGAPGTPPPPTGGPSGSQSSQYLFIGNFGDPGQVYPFRLNAETGALTVGERVSLSGREWIVSMAASRDSSFIHVSGSPEPVRGDPEPGLVRLYTLSVDRSTGNLTETGSLLESESAHIPGGIFAPRTGNCLYGGHSRGGGTHLVSYRLDASGAPVQTAEVSVPPLEAAAINPAGTRLFAQRVPDSEGNSSLLSFSLEDCTIVASSRREQAISGKGPFQMVVSGNGQYLLTVGLREVTIRVFRIGDTITEVPGSPFATGFNADLDIVTMVATANGRYVIAKGDTTARVLRLSSDGALTPAGGAYEIGRGDPIARPLMDPSGDRFVYIGRFNGVRGFRVQDDGTLTPVPGSPFAAQGDLVWGTAKQY